MARRIICCNHKENHPPWHAKSHRERDVLFRATTLCDVHDDYVKKIEHRPLLAIRRCCCRLIVHHQACSAIDSRSSLAAAMVPCEVIATSLMWVVVASPHAAQPGSRKPTRGARVVVADALDGKPPSLVAAAAGVLIDIEEGVGQNWDGEGEGGRAFRRR